jgi:hypothetical protein
MKTKVIVATLLVAATATADARFALLYPRKTLSPDESGHWIVITSNPWPHSAGSELTTATPSGGGPDPRRTVAKEASKGQLKTGMFHSASPASAP